MWTAYSDIVTPTVMTSNGTAVYVRARPRRPRHRASYLKYDVMKLLRVNTYIATGYTYLRAVDDGWSRV